MAITNQSFIKNSTSMGYKLFLPDEYENRQMDSFPLILFLHGIKKRGNDLNILDDYGLLKVAQQQTDFSYIVVAPQCPADTYWPENRMTIMELINEVMRDYRVDQSRIYLTGFSMGANGTWDLAANTKDVFAAIVPISGWYETSEVEKLTSVPIWAFHGEDDDIVPISGSESMINAMIDMGGEPKFTRYPGHDHSHNVMYETYTNPELYAWLERNKRMTNSEY